MPGCTISSAPNTAPSPISRGAGRRAAPWRAPKELFRRSNPRTRWPKRCAARPPAKGELFVINLSGRGDKDTDIYRENLKELDEPMTTNQPAL